MNLKLLGTAIVLMCTYGSVNADDLENINEVDWQMHQFDSNHRGFINAKLDVTKFTFDWSVPIGNSWSGNYTVSQAVTAGNLVFVSRNNYVYSNTLQAFSITDGQEVWGVDYGSPRISQPSTDKTRVYVQTESYSTYSTECSSYDVNDGDILFKTYFNTPWEYAISPTIFNSNAYSVGSGGLYSFNKSSGAQNWLVRNNPIGMLTPAVNAHFTIGYEDGKLILLNTESGESLFTIEDPDYSGHGESENTTAPMLLDEKTVVLIQFGYLTVFDLNKKEAIKHFGPRFTGSAATDGSMVYAPMNGNLVALSMQDMTRKWTWKKKNETVTGTIILTNNLIFLATNKSTYAIDRTTQEVVWSYPKTGKLSIAKGHLFIVSSNGILNAIKVQ